MKQFKTAAIVLRRVNFGEADRIVTFLTADYGKIGAIAKGVRRPKSKLGGGLEPFSDTIITFGEGKGELKLVLSTRLETFYRNIMTDYDRLQFGYEALRLVDRSTEEIVEERFYLLLKRALVYLDELKIPFGFTELWFRLQLEELLGRIPDLDVDVEGNRLEVDAKYTYDMHERGMVKNAFGNLTADHIKLLRLARDHSPAVLAQVQGAGDLLPNCVDVTRKSWVH